MTPLWHDEFSRAFERVFGADRRPDVLKEPHLRGAEAWHESICLGFIQSSCKGVIWRQQNRELRVLLEIDASARPTVEAEAVIEGVFGALNNLRLRPSLESVEVRSISDTEPFLEGQTSLRIHLSAGIGQVTAGLIGVVWVAVGALLIWDDQTTQLILAAGPVWLLGGLALAQIAYNWAKRRIVWLPAGLKGGA
jgi:hypothetical protein